MRGSDSDSRWTCLARSLVSDLSRCDAAYTVTGCRKKDQGRARRATRKMPAISGVYLVENGFGDLGVEAAHRMGRVGGRVGHTASSLFIFFPSFFAFAGVALGGMDGSKNGVCSHQ